MSQQGGRGPGSSSFRGQGGHWYITLMLQTGQFNQILWGKPAELRAFRLTSSARRHESLLRGFAFQAETVCSISRAEPPFFTVIFQGSATCFSGPRVFSHFPAVGYPRSHASVPTPLCFVKPPLHSLVWVFSFCILDDSFPQFFLSLVR